MKPAITKTLAFSLFIGLLFGVCYAQSFSKDLLPSVGSGELSSVKFGGKKLPSWLSSDYSPIFNGVNQTASAPLAQTLTNTWTVMFWYKPYIQAADYLITSRIHSSGGGMWLSQEANTSILLNSPTSGNIRFNGMSPVVSLTSGAWYHMAITRDFPACTVYIDGIQRQATGTNIGTFSWTTGVCFSAALSSALGNNSMAEVSLWNRPLSGDEIKKYKDKRLRGTESGLVAYYPFNEPPGSTVFKDLVGSKNAQASNSVQITRRNGYSAPDVRSERYCLSGDGVDDTCIGTQTAIIGYPFSFDVWAQSTFTADNQNLILFSIGSTTTVASEYRTVRLRQISGVNTFQMNEGGVNNVSSASGLLNGSWNHFSVVYESQASAAVYINGVFFGRNLVNYGWAGFQKINFGGVTGTSGVMKGKLANLRIWSKALSQSEIQSLMYSVSTGNESGLVGYFKLNEGTGSVATNSVAANPGSMTAVLLYSPTWVGRDIP